MKHFKIIAACAALAFSSLALAQTPCTKVADDKAHLCWTPPVLYTSGSQIPAGTAITYTVQRQSGTAWLNDATGVTASDWTSGVLQPGAYLFRVSATVGTKTSGPSNTGSRTVDSPTPEAPVLTIAVVIGVGHAPVYRIVSGNARSDSVYGMVPVGRPCTGPVRFRYRGRGYRLVDVKPAELWGTTDARNLAAACGRA